MNSNDRDVIGKLPPQVLDIEEVVIGSMMLESDCISTVFEMLPKEAFYKSIHQIIFGAIFTLYTERKNVDILTVTEELKRIKQLEIIGGAFYISQLTSRIASSAHIVDHCTLILHQYVRRKIIQVSAESELSAYDTYQDPEKIIDAFIQSGKELKDYTLSGTIESTSDLVNSIMDNIEHTEVKGRSTGLLALDNMIICLEKGLKYTIGARASMGKTSLGKTIAINLINQGSPGIIFSMEMTAPQLMTQIISGVCEISNEKLRKKTITPQEKLMIWEKMNKFKKELLIIDGKSMITPNYILKKVKRAIKNIGAEWFMLDYTQMGKVDNEKGKGKEERVGEFSQALKDIAKDENIFCLEIAQIKRLGEEDGSVKKKAARPHLAALKDSGTIEASADVVLLLYRPEYYGFHEIGPEGNRISSRGITEIIVAKNRQGPVGSCLVEFMHDYTKFIDRKVEVTDNTGINIDDHTETTF